MITIILIVSRPFFLKEVFTSIEMLDIPSDQVSLLTYVDGDVRLFEKARNYTINLRFNETLCYHRRKGEANVSSITRRRQRISDIHNEIKLLIKPTDYIFLIEDDTVIPSGTLRRLQKLYTTYPHAGMITGVEVGRWGYLHLGLWNVDDIYNVNQITSSEIKKGIEKIDSSGFYCIMTRYKTYIKHSMKPYENILGPDFEYGLSLRQGGYYNYCDYGIQCTHLTQKEKIIVKEPIVQVQFIRTNDKWELGVL